MRRVMWFSAALCFHPMTSWRLQPIESPHANTIVRLWHELHVARGVAHDFEAMLAPSTGFFVAAINHDEIRAIAHCDGDRMDNARVSTIAHKPDNPDAAKMLIVLINETSVTVDFQSRNLQPRWLLEALFVGAQ